MAETTTKHPIIGYATGIAAGVAYGMNPLFGKDLLSGGASVTTVLFFRYLFATVFMGLWLLIRRESLKVDRRQMEWLLILALLFSSSSLTLFAAYDYIPAGLATTVVYLYPVFTALIMVLLKVFPSWQVWISIAASLAGVYILMDPFGGGGFNWTGLMLSALSALSYALYLVIVNQSKQVKDLSAHSITFYALLIGTVLFLVYHSQEHQPLLTGIEDTRDWMDLVGLGLFPTLIAMLSLAIATREIGPAKTSVLGVFEPITAIAIGTLAFGEPLTTNVITGVVICLSAISFMAVSGRRRKNIKR